MKKFNELSKEEEQRAMDLHQKAIVIEGHTHGMSHMEKVIPIIQEGGVTGRILDLHGAFDKEAFNKSPYPETVIYDYEGWARRFMEQIDKVLPEFDKHPDKVSMAFFKEDFLKAKEEGKIAILLGLEGALPIEGQLELLRCYYRLGLRSMQFTWSWRNQLSDAVFEATNSGLTNFGKDVVKEMNRLGMIIGVSHLSEKGFFDTIKISQDPVIASHSNVRKLCGAGISYYYQNISDEQIKALAENDGVMGYLGCSGHHIVLFNKKQLVTLDDLLDHIDYVSDLVGSDHIAIGPDWEIGYAQATTEQKLKFWEIMTNWGDKPLLYPIHVPVQDYEDVTKTSNLTRGLVARGYSDQEILKILGENLLRVFKAVFGK